MFQGHAVKNTGSQICTASKTVHFGQFYVDMSGPRGLGLPTTAFLRRDPQSDLVHALLSCPFFFAIGDPSSPLDMYEVPWFARGSLVWSLSVALIWAPIMHPKLTAEQRLESSLTGFLLWDLWQIMSNRAEVEADMRKGAMSMAAETVTNLQSVSLSLIVILLTQKDQSSAM